MSSILLVGTVSNVEKKFVSDFHNVYRAISCFNDIDVFLVESDSSDSTIKMLENFKLNMNNFDYVSLGNVKEKYPDRIERIRFCRNRYVDYIRSKIREKEWDYIAVADLDGMNRTIDISQITDVLTNASPWDGVFANQKHGYYDLFALRHPEWMPNNCFSDLTESRKKISSTKLLKYQIVKRFKRLLDYDLTRKNSIYEKMKVIPKESTWIRVDSAFCGFAIYKSYWFRKYDYSTNAKDQFTNSEHVDFNLKCSKDGANLFIVPKLMNSSWNEYNVNRYFVIRQVRQFLGNHLRLREIILKACIIFLRK